jgi:hypothetical protein
MCCAAGLLKRAEHNRTHAHARARERERALTSHGSLRVQGLRDTADVQALVGKLVDAVNSDSVLYCLHQLEVRECLHDAPARTDGRAPIHAVCWFAAEHVGVGWVWVGAQMTASTSALRDFIDNDGIKVLRTAIKPHVGNASLAVAVCVPRRLCTQARADLGPHPQYLRALGRLPPLSRAAVEDAKLESFLQALAAQHGDDAVLCGLVDTQLARWDAVHNAYRIPKLPVRTRAPA